MKTTTKKDRQFEQLIDRELPKLRGVAFRLLRNAADTDDAIQEALIKAYQRFDTFKNEAALSSWVCRIVINCSFDLLRKRRSEQKHRGEMPPDAPGADTVAQQHAQDNLLDAIADLPEPYRDAITLGVISGYDGATAAKILGIAPNALYQRIHKAKEMLRNTL